MQLEKDSQTPLPSGLSWNLHAWGLPSSDNCALFRVRMGQMVMKWTRREQRWDEVKAEGYMYSVCSGVGQKI